jgi:hypothetical protein
MVFLVQQCLKHMQGRKLLMAAAKRQALRRLDNRLETIRVFLDSHV